MSELTELLKITSKLISKNVAFDLGLVHYADWHVTGIERNVVKVQSPGVEISVQDILMTMRLADAVTSRQMKIVCAGAGVGAGVGLALPISYSGAAGGNVMPSGGIGPLVRGPAKCKGAGTALFEGFCTMEGVSANFGPNGWTIALVMFGDVPILKADDLLHVKMFGLVAGLQWAMEISAGGSSLWMTTDPEMLDADVKGHRSS